MSKEKEVLEAVEVGSGATGSSKTADPVGGTATLPASKKQGEAMQKGQNPAGTAIEDTDGDNNTKPTGDNSAANKASVAMKEDMDAMFSGEELSEEFKEKAAVIFEAAVAAKASERVAALEEQYTARLEAAVKEIDEQLATRIDEYLNYVVEHWMQENEVAVVSSLKAELTEEFISGLKSLFEQHYIELPEEKVDVVGELAEQVEALQAKLDDILKENIELKQVTDKATQKQIFDEVAEGLALTQVEKLQALAEGVDFTGAESYKAKLQLVKENYFPASKPAVQQLTEQVEELDDAVEKPAQSAGPVAAYVKAISRTIKK